MKLISRSKALVQLDKVRKKFRAQVGENYEHRAKSCETCETPGSCCLDTHFVNVRISRLEAHAMRDVIDGLEPSHRDGVYRRIDETKVLEGKFACPLFEPSVGCLVHTEAKPLPCIAHACYERKEDLPPDHLLIEQEGHIAKLNARTYGRPAPPLPIPIALRRSR